MDAVLIVIVNGTFALCVAAIIVTIIKDCFF